MYTGCFFRAWPRFELAAVCGISNTGISICFLMYVTASSTSAITLLCYYFFFFLKHILYRILCRTISLFSICVHVEVSKKSKILSSCLSFILYVFLLYCFSLILLIFYNFTYFLPYTHSSSLSNME